MANDPFHRLASLLGAGHGTTLLPKGDGRVEIPHRMVRLMGWRDKSTVWIGREADALVLSGRKPDNLVGRVDALARGVALWHRKSVPDLPLTQNVLRQAGFPLHDADGHGRSHLAI